MSASQDSDKRNKESVQYLTVIEHLKVEIPQFRLSKKTSSYRF